MTEQWQELKDTIIEMRDNDGTGTQQEICKFLANYMDVLEGQMNSSEKLDKWIHVSERLPEIHQDVLLELRNGNMLVGFRAVEELFFYVSAVGGCYVKYENVIAWMPLPKSCEE